MGGQGDRSPEAVAFRGRRLREGYSKGRRDPKTPAPGVFKRTRARAKPTVLFQGVSRDALG